MEKKNENPARYQLEISIFILNRGYATKMSKKYDFATFNTKILFLIDV